MTGRALSHVFLRTAYLGIVFVTFTVFVFALEYTGRERYVTRRTLALLSVHPVLTVAFVTANPNGLFFTDIDAALSVFVGESEGVWGPAFWVQATYSYVVLGAVAAMILGLIVRSNRSLYRGQAVALFVATVSPGVANAVYTAGFVTFDATPVGFILAAALFTVAIVRYRLVDITPIAREKVVDNVRDGMVVTDTDGQILDTNEAFADLMGISVDSLVGTELSSLFDGYPTLSDAIGEMTDTPDPSEREFNYSGRYLNVEATPVFDDRDRHVGWLFLVTDITELTQRERDLEQQIEKLDQFAEIVSHDLRNPLNVAQGYVQQAQATGDTDQLPKALDAMDRMNEIIQDALMLAREGEAVTEPEEVSLEATARAGWRSVDTAGATLTVTDETVVADETRLQRLLENLFRNSIEHGTTETGNGEQPASGHRIEVGFEGDSPGAGTVVVGDNGTGIPDEDLDKIFESGYTTNDEGTGLGLAIVEQIASAHGWTVGAAHSEAGGARFEIRDVARPVTVKRAD